MKRSSISACVVLAFAALVCGAAFANAQEIKYDTPTPLASKPDANSRCQAGFATVYVSRVKHCAKCKAEYTAVATKGGKIICVRENMRPNLRVPDGYQPEFNKPVADSKCAGDQKLIDLYDHKHCIKCKSGYKYHPYYGQGRCIKCNDGEALHESGGKIMCNSCPGNSRLLGTYGGRELHCSCPGTKWFGWGPNGYGCYDRPEWF